MSATSGNTVEPEWIRDPSVAAVAVEPPVGTPAMMAIGEICYGELVYCDRCGAMFPMWPPKESADHTLTAHADNITVPARTGASALCDPSLNEMMVAVFNAHFMTRPSMRRRAWQLGYTRIQQPDPSRVKLVQ